MARITVTTDYRVEQGQTLTFSNDDGFFVAFAYGAEGDVTVAGQVKVSGTNSLSGIRVGGSSFYDTSDVTIDGGGLLQVTSTRGAATGFESSSWGPNVFLHGTVEVIGATSATGVSSHDPKDWRFENTGLLKVTSAGSAVGLSATGAVFKNTGEITVSGASSALGVSIGSLEPSSFHNVGSIRAVTSQTGQSVGVSFSGVLKSASAFVNDGLIEADVAIRFAPTLAYWGDGVINNGTLIGDVDLGYRGAVLTNNGRIEGDVLLGGGDDKYDGVKGRVLGAVFGGAGNDTIYSGAESETLSGGEGHDYLTGFYGEDLVSGGPGNDTIYGWTVSYAEAPAGVSVDLIGGRASGEGEDRIYTQRVIGSQFADTLAGSYKPDVLMGGAGDDDLSGDIDADTLDGGAGADTIHGGAGNDLILSGSGGAYLRGDDGNDTIVGGDDAFEDLHGNAGDDSVSGGGADDWVVGGKDQDQLKGGAGADIVYGNLGNDTCSGDEGDDIVRGGQNDDVLYGGAGDDWLSGDRHNDTISGGPGADTFHTFGDAGVDRVIDFNAAEGDRVQLDRGTVYTVHQDLDDVVIQMEGGGQMFLIGVKLATLPEGWIFTL